MSTTSQLSLPYLAAGQAQKHVTINEALRMLDALVQLSVKSSGATVPPTNPQEGDRHLLGNAPTSLWTGHAGKIAAFQDGYWVFYAPQPGWVAWHETTGQGQLWNGAQWIGIGLSNPALLGVNATADTTNRLAVRGGSVCLNSFGAVAKWIPASIKLPSGLMAAH